MVRSGRWVVGIVHGGTLPDSSIAWHTGTVISRLRVGSRTIASTNVFDGDDECDDKAMEDADEKE